MEQDKNNFFSDFLFATLQESDTINQSSFLNLNESSAFSYIGATNNIGNPTTFSLPNFTSSNVQQSPTTTATLNPTLFSSFLPYPSSTALSSSLGSLVEEDEIGLAALGLVHNCNTLKVGGSTDPLRFEFMGNWLTKRLSVSELVGAKPIVDSKTVDTSSPRWSAADVKHLLDAVQKHGADWTTISLQPWCRTAKFNSSLLSQKFDAIKQHPNSVDWSNIGLSAEQFFSTLSKPVATPALASRFQKEVRTWSSEELEALKKGVATFGEGAWMQIKRRIPLLSARTTVSLKDKWRNECKKQKNKEKKLSTSSSSTAASTATCSKKVKLQ